MAIDGPLLGMLGSDVSTVIRERPALGFGLLSVLVGVGLDIWQACSCPRRQTMRHRLRHGRRQFKATLDLPPLAIKLLANPIVQDYLRRTVLRTVSRKQGR